MDEMKFKITSQKFSFSSETDSCIVTGLENAIRIYTEKCNTCEFLTMEKISG